MVFHQVHPADRLIVSSKADFDRLDFQVPFELAEDLLRVEIAPDGRAVVVRRIGMLAADDDVGEAVVLAVDGMHDGLFRATIEHLDVQAQ